MAFCVDMLLITMMVSVVSAEITLQAVYNMGGVTGKVTFTQPSVEKNVTIKLDLVGLSNGQYTLALHEYHVNFDTYQRCSEDSIGAVSRSFGTATATSGKGTLTAEGIDLSGIRSIEGRSFVIRSGGGVVEICATIEADADYITAFAHMPAELGGTIIFRQQDNSPSADTLVYLDLYFVGKTKPQTLQWQINSGRVQMDIDAKTDIANRCGSTIKDLYNPDSQTGAGCATNTHTSCKIGDLSAKHGDITMATNGNTKAFYGDLNLPLSGENSIIDKTIAFLTDSHYYGCANIVQYHRMGAVGKFSNEEVTGSIMFSQASPLDPVAISVNIQNLVSEAGGYHVHQWPVPQQVQESEAMCDSSHVGGHFNPFRVTVDGSYPLPDTSTPDKYEVGDLSGKFGTLSTMNNYVKNMTDPNMQLFGKNTIIGRSLVIHKDLDNSPRWTCTTIWQADDIPMITAYARFTYPVIGYMVLRQPQNNPLADTQIYAELDYAASFVSAAASVAHNWHVHEAPMDNDMLQQTSRCQSVGGHYNPYHVLLAGDYSTMCNQRNHFRCELGDLSNKHGKLNIRTAAGNKMKYFFSDIQLPLSGPQSVVGKSITIHDANSGPGRLSCADIKLRVAREARVSQWSSAEGHSSPTGTISFVQDSINILSGITKIKVSLTGLESVAGYHIHEYPTSVDASQSDVCQSSDVGGHLNPFGGPSKGPSSGTQDKYEIGDLSGKFGKLSGKAYTTEILDMTLPMEGPYSVVGRSIVIHKNDAPATRWACGNIMDVTPNSRLIEHRATFVQEIKGYIHLSQYVYEHGDKSNAFLVVYLYNSSNPDTMTTGHNWQVHVNPGNNRDCMSSDDLYNPYMVNMDSGYSECGMSNPLRCAAGDLSPKLGQYHIGGGKRFYTDPNLDVEGKYSAAKRSIVLLGPNGSETRIACAHLVPYGSTAVTYELHFGTTNYTKDDVATKVAASIATDVSNVQIDDNLHPVDCTTVTVYFLGDTKATLREQFADVVSSGNHNSLKPYTPITSCTISAAGLVSVSLMTVFVCIILSKLRPWS